VGNRTILLMSSALALVLCATAPASAQVQKEGSGMPGGNATGGEGRAAKEQTGGEKSQKGTEPRGMTQGETKGQPGQSGKSTTQSEPQGKSKGTAETQPKEPGAKGSAQTQPKEPSKGSAQTQQPTEKGGKGTAETQPREPSKKGSAQTQPEPGAKGSAQTQSKEPSGKGTATETGQGAAPKTDTAKGSSGSNRVQLSEQQRSTVHSTILKESNVNRATNVTFSVSVGTRVPRSVHLAVLPASVLSIVPQYRSYQYFVANDQICIVDPSSYEIVQVISGSERTAGNETRGSTARLMLTAKEKEIILSEVGNDGGSTMGLGAVSEGAEVPRSAQVRAFPEQVVQQVPKLESYKYFTAENSVAIVDPQGSRVVVLVENRR